MDEFRIGLAGVEILLGGVLWGTVSLGRVNRGPAWWGMLAGAAIPALSLATYFPHGETIREYQALLAGMPEIQAGCLLIFAAGLAHHLRLLQQQKQRALALEKACSSNS